jgi:hypothetical protein
LADPFTIFIPFIHHFYNLVFFNTASALPDMGRRTRRVESASLFEHALDLILRKVKTLLKATTWQQSDVILM